MTDKQIHEVSKTLSSIVDKARLQVMEILRVSPATNVKTMCEGMKVSQPALSHHLSILRRLGVIDYRRDGKNNFYSLTERGKKLVDVIANI